MGGGGVRRQNGAPQQKEGAGGVMPRVAPRGMQCAFNHLAPLNSHVPLNTHTHTGYMGVTFQQPDTLYMPQPQQHIGDATACPSNSNSKPIVTAQTGAAAAMPSHAVLEMRPPSSTPPTTHTTPNTHLLVVPHADQSCVAVRLEHHILHSVSVTHQPLPVCGGGGQMQGSSTIQ